MSALYAMNFVGMGGTGGGAVYVGNGKIVGIDAGNLAIVAPTSRKVVG